MSHINNAPTYQLENNLNEGYFHNRDCLMLERTEIIFFNFESTAFSLIKQTTYNGDESRP